MNNNNTAMNGTFADRFWSMRKAVGYTFTREELRYRVRLMRKGGKGYTQKVRGKR